MRSIKDLQNLCAGLSVEIPVQDDISPLAQSLKIGPVTISNRLAVHPMEGADGDSDGKPGELTFRRYKRFAQGGCGIIWFEAIAVVPEGRANPRQLWLYDTTRDAFADLIIQTRKAARQSLGSTHNPFLIAQLTHSGRYSRPKGTPEPIIPQRNKYLDTSDINDRQIVSDDYLDGLIEHYVKSAKLAFEVGFDAVDIKACHGYLISELLACYNRNGKYGGSFENRTRFLLTVIDEIYRQIGKDKIVVTRLGIYDAIPYSFGWGIDKNDFTKYDLAEPKKLFELLSNRNIPIISVSIANPYYNPHLSRPYDKPVKGGYQQPEHPIVGIERLLRLTGQMQKEFPKITLVGTGYSWLRHLLPNVGAAVLKKSMAGIIGAGRMALAYPDFAKDILTKGKLNPDKVCIACSACSQIMRDGGKIGCVVRDNKIYGPIYKQGRVK